MLIPVVPYQPRWADQFTDFAHKLRESFGRTAHRIDHIGSTAVEGLAAKSVIDIQVTVASLSVVPDVSPGVIAQGFIFLEAIDSDRPPPWETDAREEWRKAYFRTPDGAPIRSHIHVRERGRRNQRYALLFRDYLRSSARARAAYGDFKLQLAAAVGHLSEPGGTGPYLDLKDPMLDLIADAAESWALARGWDVDGSGAA